MNVPFKEFWDLYSKKIDRPKCERKWKRLTLKTKQAIMDYLPKYKESTPDKQYRKHPATFLNNESWENEIILNGKPEEKKEVYVAPKEANIMDFIDRKSEYNKWLKSRI